MSANAQYTNQKQRGTMSCIRVIGRIVAVWIAFAFVVITPPLLLAYNAQQAVVDGDFLDELFDDTEFFEDVIPEIADDLAREIKDDPETRDAAVARFTASDWERVIFVVAPPESMQRWSQEALEGFRQWVRSGRGRFLDDVIMPFGEVRDNIVNDSQDTVLRSLLQTDRECSGGQEALEGPNDLIPQCRPTTSELEDFVRILGGRWREQPRELWRQLMPGDLARYPDNISLADFIERESGEEWDARVNWRASSWGFRASRWLLAVCIAGQCVVALLLVALFAARNWREALRWTGTPLILAGIFTVLLAMVFFAGAEIGTWFISEDDVPIGVQEMIRDTARAFSDEMWLPMALQAGLLVLVGFGLWALSFIVPVRPEPVPSAVAPPQPPEPTVSAGQPPHESVATTETGEPAAGAEPVSEPPEPSSDDYSEGETGL